MIERIRKWRIKQVAKKVSLALKEYHGEKKYYSATELEDAIRSVGLSRAQREFAYAMFTDEEICNGFLSRIGSSKTAAQLRSFLGGGKKLTEAAGIRVRLNCWATQTSSKRFFAT